MRVAPGERTRLDATDVETDVVHLRLRVLGSQRAN